MVAASRSVKFSSLGTMARKCWVISIMSLACVPLPSN
eukprot:CAMPEP_0195142992 /NCGR_PEP_ID=MMETSP0448-20130528/165548_1 /TAXON_ID=66468 /ORGANISM="Heterocapsa triquestra, Strain CCMP 448" /LENGTH=36 /DNA_ID= /DNA_START= /DNA_END= /DNA_ORIENTATION=